MIVNEDEGCLKGPGPLQSLTDSSHADLTDLRSALMAMEEEDSTRNTSSIKNTRN